MILFLLNLNSLSIIGSEVFHEFLSDLINYVTRARRHFLPRYSKIELSACVSHFSWIQTGVYVFMPTRHIGKNDVESVRAREKGTWTVVEKSRRRKDEKGEPLVGWRERKVYSPCPRDSEQSIKNVSRAEIIKVRISGRQQGAMRDEERRCMMQGDQWGW